MGRRRRVDRSRSAGAAAFADVAGAGPGESYVCPGDLFAHRGRCLGGLGVSAGRLRLGVPRPVPACAVVGRPHPPSAAHRSLDRHGGYGYRTAFLDRVVGVRGRRTRCRPTARAGAGPAGVTRSRAGLSAVVGDTRPRAEAAEARPSQRGRCRVVDPLWGVSGGAGPAGWATRIGVAGLPAGRFLPAGGLRCGQCPAQPRREGLV
jgi:hypothetical protein